MNLAKGNVKLLRISF